MPHRIDVLDLGYFAEVARQRNVSRAEEALDLSQPALSKAMRGIEKALETKVAQHSAAITAQFTPAEFVGEDQHYIGRQC